MTGHRGQRTPDGGHASDSQAVGADVETFMLADDGVFSNNAKLPVLVYRGALSAVLADPQAHAQETFAQNHWTGSWVDGIYDFHHYHSTAHEVLAICSGHATVQLGGDRAVTLDVTAGDVLVLPAGTAHKRLRSSRDLVVVGAYPQGQHYDMCYGKEGERPAADCTIAGVPLPPADPLHGPDGPLMKLWKP
ncbi:MAG: cupin domain-containing protein [Sedimentisphaerales bacterium]|nr:cupin domain-containing protein [Sedimentisphaerales bacterium]